MKRILILALTLVPNIAVAGGGAGHEASIADLFWYWCNFIVFCSIMFMLLKKPMASFWGNRWKAIESQINKGEQALLAAEEQFKEARVPSLHTKIKYSLRP